MLNDVCVSKGWGCMVEALIRGLKEMGGRATLVALVRVAFNVCIFNSILSGRLSFKEVMR